MDESKIPIIVSCGQITQKEEDPNIALSPMDLTAKACFEAAKDSEVGNKILESLDTILVIRSFSDTSWRFTCPFGKYINPPYSLSNRINANNVKKYIYSHPGGNMPQWSVNRIFELITKGEIKTALIAGGESLSTQKKAQRLGIKLNWNEDPGSKFEEWGISKKGWSRTEEIHGMKGAIYAYPLIENAIRGKEKRSILEHNKVMGEILEKFANIAKDNPLADRKIGYSAETISSVSAVNPYIGFPYTKLMNANAFIDQSAAIIITSVKNAKELGIPKNKWVYLHGCADAYDHWFLSDRVNFYSSPAMNITCKEALEMAECNIEDIDFFDIYSCFPSAIKIACDEMGININTGKNLTVTGGLPYFGGPGNNYVTHSISEIVKRVRKYSGSRGLVTANGNYITKQSIGIYSSNEPIKPFMPKDTNIYQDYINKLTGPKVRNNANGKSTIETYTVINDKDGPTYSILYGKMEDGSRFIANTPKSKDLLLDMMSNDYLNIKGKVINKGGINIFYPN